MRPTERPIPRFIADTTQEGIPHGRFAERLREEFAKAVGGARRPAGGSRGPGRSRLVPRARLGRARLGALLGPHRERGGAAGAVRPRLLRAATRRASRADFGAKADFTDILAEDNPDWRIDLNDDVIGRWRGENGRAGAVTLVWGRPLVRGAVAATAVLETETVDQELISQDRFTLIALDALEGYGDEVFMEVKLWSRRADELASETLYA